MGSIGNKAAAATKNTAVTATPQRPAAAPAQQRQAPQSFAQARPRGASGLYLKGQADGTAGKYTLRVNKVSQMWANPKFVDDQRPQPTEAELATAKPTFKKQDNFIVEVEVVESNVEACPVGYMASIVLTDRYPDSYFDDIKGFLCAVTGDDPEEIGLEDWKASYQPDQPLAGHYFDCLVQERPTKGGGVFTKHIFNESKLKKE